MTTLDKVLTTHDKLCGNAKNIIETKGRDYNRKQQNNGDTLFNLTVAKQLGIVDSVTQSILVRISDKLMRLVSLTSNPREEPAVTTEKVQDTIEDSINYLVYLYCKYEEERNTRISQVMENPE